ncbi:hypothetical protein RCH18_002520 [Flavobacterium sp. PL11]|uniref:hypothetical protein n=1 Tax=Flavobacterium sp. PL11 TaxID=3071717 RepID=UPI002DF7F5A8|nr:hypothetical protein [Flavobacterium sp. PL11]
MNITYYLIGVLTGFSLSTFFIGKELYKYYNKYKVQQKQLDRILKLNDKIKEIHNFEINESISLSRNKRRKNYQAWNELTIPDNINKELATHT